jgi:hypothetical protein
MLTGACRASLKFMTGFDKLCHITLATSFPNEQALRHALGDRCLTWVKDWDSRRLATAGPDSDYSSLAP